MTSIEAPVCLDNSANSARSLGLKKIQQTPLRPARPKIE
jgi:hypothetical protein